MDECGIRLKLAESLVRDLDDGVSTGSGGCLDVNEIGTHQCKQC